jgi:hypothetical protein
LQVESLPRDIDERLWIERGCPGRDFLFGNCHTFAGRMAAYCPPTAKDVCVSIDEIRAMSDEATLWVAGFLAGNESDPETR